MAHVFIVDEKTLPVHLKYLFAGTGAKDFECDFLDDMQSSVQPSRERLLVGMIADISRVKPGDDVLFYLQQTSIYEGMFYGSFKVASNPFLCDGNYLKNELGKKLTFRVELIPGKVYSKGITERECLDSLDGIDHPSQMCWSLIYRKLKANRGCTMITDFEYRRIINKIAEKNSGLLESDYYDFDSYNHEIVKSSILYKYLGSKQSLNILDRFLYKKNRHNAYETHLQAYILQNLSSIAELRVNNKAITWIGNEVSCGVGMQSIDVAFIQEDKNEADFVICELKDEQPVQYIQKQIQKYVSWMKEYIVPTYNKKVVIYPTIIAPEPTKKTIKAIRTIINSTIYNTENLEIKEIRYIGFIESGNSLTFKEIIF